MDLVMPRKISKIFCLFCVFGGLCQANGETSLSGNQSRISFDALSSIAQQVPSVLTVLHKPECRGRSCDLTDRCYNDTAVSVEDFNEGKDYARQMYYAYGTIQLEAEFTRSYKFLGNFGLCRYANPVSEGRLFSSQYCLATMVSKEKKRVELGVCFPNTCSDAEVAIIVTQASMAADVSSGNSTVHCTKPIPLSTGAILAICICVMLGVTLTAATLYDAWLLHRHKIKRSRGINNDNGDTGGHVAKHSQNRQTRKNCQSTLLEIFLVFSVYKNYKRWCNLSQRPGTITCLHGIRVISCLWIILGHTYQYTGRYFPDNPYYILNVVLKRWSAQIYLNGYLAVDTFFVIGGMLVAYLTLKHLNNSSGKLNWALFLFHRYWRLTPVYMFVLLLWTTLIIHTGTGPRWHYLQRKTDLCHEYFWSNLLYINNFWYYTNQCMPWAWYLALDMQFHMITPIFLCLLHRRWKLGVGVLIGVLILSFAAASAISSIVGLSPDLTSKPYSDQFIYNPIGGWLYDKPYYRIQAYIVGILLGFLFYRTDGKTIKIDRCITVVLWCLSVAMGLAIVLGLYPTYQGTLFPQAVSVLYITLSKFTFSVAVAWVIFACHHGYAGAINHFLSWKIWIPLSRLTYCVYLIHPVIIESHNACREVLYHYTDENMVYFYLGVVSLSYLSAVVLTLGVEFPLSAVERVVLEKFKKDKPKRNQAETIPI